MKMLAAVILFGLVGCGKGGIGVEVTGYPICSAIISWTAPTEREADADGNEAAFVLEEIARYDLYIGLAAGDYYRQVGILDRYAIQWEEADLKGGRNYFTMTVTDNAGLTSDEADGVYKQVDKRCQQ